MSFNKKAQAMDPKELVLTLIIVGAFAIVGLLIFSSVSNTTDTILDNVLTRTTNESFTISDTATDWQNNGSTLAQNGFVTSSQIFANSSDESEVLVSGTDYFLIVNGDSGKLATTANFTLNIDYNNTAIEVSYDTNEESTAKVSTDLIQTTVLDSFELGVIALIVLAAVVILAVLFKLGQ